MTGVSLESRTATFNIDRGPMVAGVAIISNRGAKTKVKAQLNYYSERDAVLNGVSYVCWLGETFREVLLGHGDTAELILFLIADNELQAVENRNKDLAPELAFSRIIEKQFFVDAELFFSDQLVPVGFRYHVYAAAGMPIITSRPGEFGKRIL